MTVSFHRYGHFFFPGTGSPLEVGFGHGRWHTLNIPFDAGLTDTQFWSVFQPVMQKVMEVYQPGAVVLQCGGFTAQTSSICLLGALYCLEDIRDCSKTYPGSTITCMQSSDPSKFCSCGCLSAL